MRRRRVPCRPPGRGRRGDRGRGPWSAAAAWRLQDAGGQGRTLPVNCATAETVIRFAPGGMTGVAWACHDQPVESWGWWLIAAGVLVIGELFAGDFVLIMLAAGAAAAGLAGALGFGIVGELVVFAVVSALALF